MTGRQPRSGYARRVGERIENLPLFPLAQVALFPRVHCPLQLFEPRYLQMAADALEGARRIGMIAVRPEATDEMAGDPPLFQIGCAGIIEKSKLLPDGRYNIVLLGTERFRVLEEVLREGERLYRVARVEILDDPLPEMDAAHVAALRARVLGQLGDLLRHSAPERAAEYEPSRLEDTDDTTLVNLLSQALQLPPAEKQSLLETADVRAHYEHLETLLGFALASTAGVPSPGAPSVH